MISALWRKCQVILSHAKAWRERKPSRISYADLKKIMFGKNIISISFFWSKKVTNPAPIQEEGR